MRRKNLPRRGIVDEYILTSLRTLLRGDGIVPSDLPNIEMALRALILMPEISQVPDLAYADGHPVGDSIIDYDFVELPVSLPEIGIEEDDFLSERIKKLLAASFDLPFEKLTIEQARTLLSTVPVQHIGDWMEPDWAEDMYEQRFVLKHYGSLLNNEPRERFLRDYGLEPVLAYARKLISCHRGGYTVFSGTSIGKTCQEHIFSAYPTKLFQHLDDHWNAHTRDLCGPTIGLTVPPLFAVVLSRVNNLYDLSGEIRDLREEYTASRNKLWDHLDEMWAAETVAKQVKLLRELERAGSNIFSSAFPERCEYLEVAWSASLKLAGGNPFSALDEIGKKLLKMNNADANVSAIGLCKHLSRDLRRVGGLDTLLQKVLTKAELSTFDLR